MWFGKIETLTFLSESQVKIVFKYCADDVVISSISLPLTDETFAYNPCPEVPSSSKTNTSPTL